MRCTASAHPALNCMWFPGNLSVCGAAGAYLHGVLRALGFCVACMCVPLLCFLPARLVCGVETTFAVSIVGFL